MIGSSSHTRFDVLHDYNTVGIPSEYRRNTVGMPFGRLGFLRLFGYQRRKVPTSRYPPLSEALNREGTEMTETLVEYDCRDHIATLTLN